MTHGALFYKTKESPTVTDRVIEARELRALKLTYAEIGMAMGREVDGEWKALSRQRVHQLLRYQGRCAEPARAQPRRPRPCQKCGVDLGPKTQGNPQGTHCRSCSRVKPPVKLVCPTCGLAFEVLASAYGRPFDRRYKHPRRFCSPACIRADPEATANRRANLARVHAKAQYESNAARQKAYRERVKTREQS